VRPQMVHEMSYFNFEIVDAVMHDTKLVTRIAERRHAFVVVLADDMHRRDDQEPWWSPRTKAELVIPEIEALHVHDESVRKFVPAVGKSFRSHDNSIELAFDGLATVSSEPLFGHVRQTIHSVSKDLAVFPVFPHAVPCP